MSNKNGSSQEAEVVLSETDKVKGTMAIIERFFHAMNDTAGFAPRNFDAITTGMAFLAQVHQDMFNKLPEEDKAKAKKAQTINSEAVNP